MNGKPFLFALVLVLAGLAITPQAAAQSASTWTQETVVTGGVTCNRVTVAYEDEQLGVLCYNTATTTAIFTLRDPTTGTWTVKNTDVNGADATFKVGIDLISLGSDKWVAVLQDAGGTGSRAFYSIDDGATWTSGGAMTQYVNGGQLRQISGDTIAYVNGGTTNAAWFSKSTDKGATWTTPIPISDNSGSPAQTTPTATAVSASNIGPGLAITNANQYVATVTSSSAVYVVNSDDGGSFWKTPYTVNGGSTLDPFTSWNTNCPGSTISTSIGAAYAKYGTQAFVKTNGAGNPYVCAGNAPVPSTTGVASLKAGDGGNRALVADNAAGQVLVAYADNSATVNAYVYYKAPGATTFTQVYTNALGVGANQMDLTMTPTKGWFLFVDNVNGGPLRAAWATAFVSTTVNPGDVVTITSLGGVDVNPAGSTIITREGGNLVRIRSGYNLAQLAEQDTHCNRLRGVSVIDSLDGVNRGTQIVSYLYCSATDATDVTQMRVRDAALSPPKLPKTCDGFTDFCYYDVPDGELDGSDDARIEISDLQNFPYDYSQKTTYGANRIFLMWAYTDDTGRVGVVLLVQESGTVDTSLSESRVIVPGSSGLFLCTSHNERQDRDYVYAGVGGPTGQIMGFEVQVKDPLSTDNRQILMPTRFQGGQVRSPYSMGCAQNFLLTAGQGSVRLWDVETGQYREVSTDANIGGLTAIDPTATVGAYTISSKIHEFYLSNFTEIGTYDIPAYTGTPCKMELSNQGKVLFWAACGPTGTLARWDVNPKAFRNFTYDPATDTDADGVPNTSDVDIDNDGICNGAQGYAETSTSFGQTWAWSPNGGVGSREGAPDGGCKAGPDPDVDGDGQCNGNVSLLAGTPGAINGCTAGDLDDDQDGIPDNLDASATGITPATKPATASALGADRPGEFCKTKCEIVWGLVLHFVAAILAWALSGGLRRNKYGDWQPNTGSPPIMGAALGLTSMGCWFLNPWFILSTITIVVFAGIAVWLKVGRKTSGAQ